MKAFSFFTLAVVAQAFTAEKELAQVEIEPVGPLEKCICRSDYDCKKSEYCPNKCVFDKYSLEKTGLCKDPIETRPPTTKPTPSPTMKPTPSPTMKPTDRCTCQSDYDCLKSPYCPNKCVFNKYSSVGACEEDPPTPPPTKTPTSSPTTEPGSHCECESDYDCINSPYCTDTCVFEPYSSVGTCGETSPTPPTKEPSNQPTGEGGCCDEPRSIPTECEVELLIELMETAALVNIALIPQWLRLSFHDAGTFDQAVPEGGANGCLLTHPPMRFEPENDNLDLALIPLQNIKNAWENHMDTCLSVSAADMIQFSGWFSVIRQKDSPGLTSAKIDELVNSFQWGRPDEQACDVSWTENLPGFSLGTDPSDIEARCLFAGGEVKEKMMDRNGFSAEEATALIGAHTIGLTRHVFGSGLAGPWVLNGADNATPDGPVFDNAFHDFLDNTIIANDAAQFAVDPTPFDSVNGIFPDWFRDTVNGLNHLDTDVALAFPSQNLAIHPHFHTFTEDFADDNQHFLDVFMVAFEKMSSLGVEVALVPPLTCDMGCIGTDGDGSILTPDVERELEDDIKKAIEVAENNINDKNKERKSEIDRLTTPVLIDIEEEDQKFKNHP